MQIITLVSVWGITFISPLHVSPLNIQELSLPSKSLIFLTSLAMEWFLLQLTAKVLWQFINMCFHSSSIHHSDPRSLIPALTPLLMITCQRSQVLCHWDPFLLFCLLLDIPMVLNTLDQALLETPCPWLAWLSWLTHSMPLGPGSLSSSKVYLQTPPLLFYPS